MTDRDQTLRAMDDSYLALKYRGAVAFEEWLFSNWLLEVNEVNALRREISRRGLDRTPRAPP